MEWEGEMSGETMGRIWLASALNDALIFGKRVAVFSGILKDSRNLFKEIEEYLVSQDFGNSIDRVCAVNGQEHIDLVGGGRLIFLSLRQIPYGALRGRLLDVVYWPASEETYERVEEVIPALATSKDGRIVRYID